MQQAAHLPGLLGGRTPVAGDLHVTLCFLGAVEQTLVAQLTRRAAAISTAAFELEFDVLEYWHRARVLAAVCSRVPAAALALAEALRSSAQSLGLTAEQRPWCPHVTLRRGLASAAAPPLPLAAPLHLRARSFYLAQSQELEATSAGAASARYRRVAAWPLRMAAV